MITEKERMVEWLTRSAISVSQLKNEQNSSEELLAKIRSNYATIEVLKKVASGKAYMIGIMPPRH